MQLKEKLQLIRAVINKNLELNSCFEGIKSKVTKKFILFFNGNTLLEKLEIENFLNAEETDLMYENIAQSMLSLKYQNLLEFDTPVTEDISNERDFSLAHGVERFENCEGLLETLEDFAVSRLNGKLYYPEETDLNSFWCNGGYQKLCEGFDVIDPENLYTITHRKGKDWFITKSIKHIGDLQYVYDAYINEEEICLKTCWADINQFVNEDKKTLKKLERAFLKTKQMLECDGLASTAMNSENNSWHNFLLYINSYQMNYCNYEFLDLFYPSRNSIAELEEKIVEIRNSMLIEAINTGKFVLRNLDCYFEYSKKANDKLSFAKNFAAEHGCQIVASKYNESRSNYEIALRFQGEDYHLNLGLFLSPNKNDNLGSALEDAYSFLLYRFEKREIEEEQRAEFYNLASKVEVTKEDSLNAGNCEIGTTSFIKTHKLKELKSINGKKLLMLEDSSFTRRAVNQALLRNNLI